MMPRWIRWVWVTLAMVLGVWALGQALNIVLLLGVALLLTSALVPAVSWLQAHRCPRWLAIGVCFLSLLALIGGILAFLVPVLIAQTQQAFVALPFLAANLDWLRETWAGWREQYSVIPRFSELLNLAGSRMMPLLNRMLYVPGQFVTGAFMAFTALFLAFFFLKDGATLRRQVLGLLPACVRGEVEGVWCKTSERVGKYILGQLTVMAIVGILTGIGLWVLGIPYPLLLGLLVGLLDIVPFIGPFLGAIPGVLLGFAHSWQTGLWAIAVYWGVQQLEGYVLYPYITGKAVSLHPVWILLALLLGGQFLGIVGMSLAVPAAVALQVVLDECYRPRLRRYEHRRTSRTTEE
jgi:predicted PurR-regulated permease PerM